MSAYLPNDASGDPIPVLRLRPGGAHKVSVGASSARNGTAIDPGTRVVALYADVDVYLKFGPEGVVATTADHFFPAGIYYDLAVGGGAGVAQTPFVAALRAGTTDGTLYISEKD